MTRSDIDIPIAAIDAVPAVLAVHRTGSATAAAQSLGVGVATVLRRLGKLEEELGCVLFDRAPSGLRPTGGLERLLPFFEQIESTTQAIRREVAALEQTPEGEVRLATLPVVSGTILAPRVPGLLARHPKLRLELLPASATVDLEGRQADLALRLHPPSSGDLIVQRVYSFALGAFASAELAGALASRPRPSWPWVTWSRSLADQPESQWLHALVAEPRLVLRSSDLDTLLAAAEAGVGVIVAATPLALARGLVALPVPEPAPTGGLWLVAHRALRTAPRVDAVWSWIAESLTG